MHFNGRFVMNLVQFAAQLGADRQALVDLSGQPAEVLCREDCKLDAEVYNRVMEACVEQTGDPYFGLHAGEHMNLAAAGLMLQIAQTSATVKQALEYAVAFANLGCSALPSRLLEEEAFYKFTLTPDKLWEQQSPVAVEHTLHGYIAFTIREYHSLTRYKHYPKEVWLRMKRPQNPAELERVLHCPIKFEQVDNALLLDKKQVEEKVTTSDFGLLQVLVAHAERKLEQLEESAGFYEVVKRSVMNLVKPEFPTIEQVAAHLNMSVRTFQRKLKEEGHSYKALIDELRQDFAKNYLQKQDITISEVAYLLSYADTSAFTRSFKRWTGQTPKEYRDALVIPSKTV